MPESLAPATAEDLREVLLGCSFAVATGAGTKPALAEVPESYARLSTRRLTGVVEYEPSEYTVTVRAGTPVAELREILASQGQHLPCDPPLAGAGATIGGTVAAGLSGPGAFRFGPLRDFLIGVRYLDSAGRWLTGGGRVVKNAAGFDTPKFLIGSAGRLGILTELTFKVFPRPEATATFALAADHPLQAIAAMERLAREPHDLEALDYDPHSGAVRGRLAGTAAALEGRLRRLESSPAAPVSLARVDDGEAADHWQGEGEFAWAPPDHWLAKIPIVPADIDDLESLLNRPGLSRRYSLGGNVAWIAGSPENRPLLEKIGRPALRLRDPGGAGSPWVNPAAAPAPLLASLKAVFDPRGCFPAWSS